MLTPIRRVVTGHNAHGRSVIVADGPSPHVLTIPGVPTFGLTNLWVTDGAPADNTGAADAAARPVVLEPPANGTIFRVVEFPPDNTLAGFDRKAAFESMGAGHAMDRDASRHPGMHRTATVDYAIVLSGELGADGRGRGAPPGRRRARAAGNEPRVEQPGRRAVPGGVHPRLRRTRVGEDDGAITERAGGDHAGVYGYLA